MVKKTTSILCAIVLCFCTFVGCNKSTDYTSSDWLSSDYVLNDMQSQKTESEDIQMKDETQTKNEQSTGKEQSTDKEQNNSSKNISVDKTQSNISSENTEKVNIKITLNDVDVTTVYSVELKNYLKSPYNSVPNSDICGKKELSRSGAIVLTWKWTALDGSIEEPAFWIEIGENFKLSDAKKHFVGYGQTSYDFYNAKGGTTYYWRVSDGTNTSAIKYFNTGNICPRFINMSGVSNMRDLGGYKTEDGYTVNQGLLYRSAALDWVDTTGKQTASILGIKTEIDLRLTEKALKSSALGKDIKFYNFPMDDMDFLKKENIQSIKQCFSALADENNYPLVFHCQIGADRTGMMSYLILALLGVPEEEIYRDYLYTNFAPPGVSRQLSQCSNSTYARMVHNAEGSTLREKAYNALCNIGVPQSDLDSVIKIMKTH